MEDKYLSISEYAKKIGKSPVTVRQKCERGTLKGAFKIGRYWVIPENQEYTKEKTRKKKSEKL